MDLIKKNTNEESEGISEPKDVAPEPVTPAEPAQTTPVTPQEKIKKPSKFKEWFKRHKKAILITVPIVVVLLFALAGWFYYKQPAPAPASDTSNAKVTTTTPPAPVTVADPLTGLQVSQDAANQPVVGVMIENLFPDARPQSGLSSAGAVYEALAEGGITRFMAMFQEPLPTSVGPIRSLRPYYLRWGLEYNAPVAHAGGSQPALADIGPLKLKNIDALAYDGSYFFRTSDRAAPHNLYTNNDKLSALVAKLGWATAPTFTPHVFKADAALATATHTKITINYGMAAYNVEWDYSATNNNYARVQGGAIQKDRNTSLQLTAKNVVVEYTPTTYSTQPDGKPETNINLVGTGKALVFEDGDVTTATWSKASDSAETLYTDSTGAPVKFNTGNTWYEVVPVGSAVTD